MWWEAKVAWRRVRGQHGAFRRGEVSARAAQLTDLWQRTWPKADPLGPELRNAYSDRWVRYHSLPDSKRYADTSEEYDEIFRRHRTVLRELHGSDDLRALHVIAAEGDWRTPGSGWARRRIPDVWPWRTSPPDTDPDVDPFYFWAASGLSGPDVDTLLLAVADDECRFVIGAPDLAWLYCPYDGGADVLLPDTVERDVLKERHADWLSSHPDGL